ncbi:MAG: penicillin-binding protein 2 [Leptolyngbya sp. SIO4C5]|uniref:penicillin-binding protein 2 n=1 Tax=Sphaerothrix gracilis TaxID=3151835 RepID=UPI0013C19C56|nr:penicillin-binding protein 2 [Leptolyngbya sp. SIO4C5]
MAFTRFSPTLADKTTRTVGRQYQSLVIMLLVSLGLLGGIGSRLFYLQLIEGNRNRQLAENNRILLLPKRPARGTILDRNGKILAGSRLSHSVSIWPIALPETERDRVVERLARLLDISAEAIQSRLEQAGHESTQSVPIARGLSPAQAIALTEYSAELPGVRVEAEAVRNYPHGDLAAHVLGYTGEMTDEELLEREEEGYRLGDVVGQMGAEAAFEPQLRGVWGGQQVEVDSSGRIIKVLGEKPATSGNDISLTINLDLQRAAEAALGNRIGAIVALDPRNGEVLAMVSRPTFDPNIFSTQISDEQWNLLQGRNYPFLNRSLRTYPPASTYKIVTTSAAIESGRYSPNTVLATYPYITAGGIQFWDWNLAGFGPLGFQGAMAWSSDTFFYQTAMGMGEEPLIQWSKRYGFGQKTGIELATEESAGLVPDEAWKQEILDEGWYLGDTINMSIGQGYMQTSPLQVAVMFAVPANGGYRVKPHLLKDDADAKQWRDDIGLQPSTVKILQQGLRQVITGGTGKALNIPSLPPVSGKSGTAEAPPYENHTWFGAYGPTDDPEIVVVAFGEHSGGGGGSIAAPMVRQVLEAYFKNNGQVSAE